MVYGIDMDDMVVADLGMVYMRMVDMGMIVEGVVEPVVGKLEVVSLVVEVVGEDCLKDVEVVDEGYLMKVEVVEEDCSMNVHARFDTHHQPDFDHRV